MKLLFSHIAVCVLRYVSCAIRSSDKISLDCKDWNVPARGMCCAARRRDGRITWFIFFVFYFLSWVNDGELYYVKCLKINAFAPYYFLVKLLSKTVLLLILPASYSFVLPILFVWVAGVRLLCCTFKCSVI
jgi:hypothetical protein